MTLFFMRHGESEANVQRVLASQTQVPLTPRGREDAQGSAREFLARFSPARIISSPLKRARQTAEPFSRLTGIPVEEDPRLMEQHLGRFTSMNYDEAEAQSDYVSAKDQRWLWRPRGGGESYQMIGERISSFLQDMRGEGPVLIITHAVAMRLIWGALKNSYPQYFLGVPSNGEIWEVNFIRLGIQHPVTRHFLGNCRVHRP